MQRSLSTCSCSHGGPHASRAAEPVATSKNSGVCLFQRAFRIVINTWLYLADSGLNLCACAALALLCKGGCHTACRYPAAEVRVVDEAGDVVKRRVGEISSWETPRAPFEARTLPPQLSWSRACWQVSSWETPRAPFEARALPPQLSWSRACWQVSSWETPRAPFEARALLPQLF